MLFLALFGAFAGLMWLCYKNFNEQALLEGFLNIALLIWEFIKNVLSGIGNAIWQFVCLMYTNFLQACSKTGDWASTVHTDGGFDGLLSVGYFTAAMLILVLLVKVASGYYAVPAANQPE